GRLGPKAAQDEPLPWRPSTAGPLAPPWPAGVGARAAAVTTTWARRDPLLQPHDVEAAFPPFAARIRCFLRRFFARFHGEPPFEFGLQYNGSITSRRADRAPGRCRAGESLLAADAHRLLFFGGRYRVRAA